MSKNTPHAEHIDPKHDEVFEVKQVWVNARGQVHQTRKHRQRVDRISKPIVLQVTNTSLSQTMEKLGVLVAFVKRGLGIGEAKQDGDAYPSGDHEGDFLPGRKFIH